jgi:hypothetical protein
MELFGWMFGGEVAVPTANPDVTFHTPEPSARMIREVFGELGALIGGRRYFDLAGGWAGTHPAGVPTFIVTHNIPHGWPRPNSNIRFVTDGLDSAVEAATTTAADNSSRSPAPTSSSSSSTAAYSMPCTSTSSPCSSAKASRSSHPSRTLPCGSKGRKSSKATA